MAAALELAREGYRPPRSADGLMLNAMVIHERLRDWHTLRRFPGVAANYLSEAYWRWPGMAYDDAHGVPQLGIGFENLRPHGGAGRPPKSR